MDKTQKSPSRENYEELDGLTEEEIEARVIYVNIVPFDEVIEEAVRIYLEGLKKDENDN